MSLMIALSRFPRAIEAIAFGEFSDGSMLTLKDAYIYLYLARQVPPAPAVNVRRKTQAESAAEIGVSEPTLSASLRRLDDAGFVSDLRINNVGEKEFSVTCMGGARINVSDKRWLVADKICFGSEGSGQSKELKVLLTVLLCLCDCAGVIKGLSDKTLSKMLCVNPQKALNLLSEAEKLGYVMFRRQIKRGYAEGNDNKILAKLYLPWLLELGFHTECEVVRLVNYSSGGELSSEGVSRYLERLYQAKQESDQSVDLLFSQDYLVDPPLLWPEMTRPYFLNRGSMWTEDYRNKNHFFPSHVIKKISEFDKTELDEEFLYVSMRLIEDHPADLVTANDNTMNAACSLIRERILPMAVENGYKDEQVKWLEEELAICLIRQAQRARMMLFHALGWKENGNMHLLECGRTSYPGKLNTYEVIWVVKSINQGLKEVRLDLERYDGSVSIRKEDLYQL